MLFCIFIVFIFCPNNNRNKCFWNCKIFDYFRLLFPFWLFSEEILFSKYFCRGNTKHLNNTLSDKVNKKLKFVLKINTNFNP